MELGLAPRAEARVDRLPRGTVKVRRAPVIINGPDIERRNCGHAHNGSASTGLALHFTDYATVAAARAELQQRSAAQSADHSLQVGE